jgi:NAD(P) transhydrogenase subunit alpha
VTNAISSVIVVGALLAVGVRAADRGDPTNVWIQGGRGGFIALILAA